MEKIVIEVCMISAQGLPRSSFFLWKPQWFAVGWIDPDSKYCSRIDGGSGSGTNPTWRTKFSMCVDGGEMGAQGLALTVEVHIRDNVFLTDRLHGSVTVPLKQFLRPGGPTPTMGFEEVGSFQLRRKNSGKPCGFVDLSVSFSGQKETDHGSSHSSAHVKVEGGVESSDSPKSYHPQYHPSISSYEQKTSSPPPPPPPPPSNVGFIPSFFPTTERSQGTYMNLPPTRTPGPNTTHAGGFAAGTSAGALAAGAVIFGDDFMSNSSLQPSSFGGGGDESNGASIHPPF